jgi:hypothetical protein
MSETSVGFNQVQARTKKGARLLFVDNLRRAVPLDERGHGYRPNPVGVVPFDAAGHAADAALS